MLDLLTFEDTEIEVIRRDGEMWFTARDLAEALGYADDRAVHRLYQRNEDEFTADMSCTVKLTVQGDLSGQSDHAGQRREVRVFSLRGAHLVAMLAKTERAKAFRRWVLDLIEEEGERRPPAAGLPVAAFDPFAAPLPADRAHLNRIAHWRGIRDQAAARLAELGDPPFAGGFAGRMPGSGGLSAEDLAELIAEARAIRDRRRADMRMDGNPFAIDLYVILEEALRNFAARR
ncbi:BRO-N domain-containing protein [Albimonas pacifica]|uniref:BRO family, N-terminal domain n=1 Tax=Albimonas pacifica TaxID=1114924 RepID=A0A1I3JHG5_9RHOB|nr:BRO family protein [Albimonas pacifica]SFI59687.1 BRO family, N-terminal domain [Albimonas pacifica]